MDTIADFMTVIRNGCMARKSEVEVGYSRLRCEVLRVLLEEGYINNFELDNADAPRKIRIRLKFDEQGRSVIHGIVRVSKPGRRVYVKADEIRPVHQGLGVALISTTKGILTDRQARRMKVGGELIGYVY
ncbi:MAG TPA: 30S ribosomal protein S8 [bacterium (Candidatus Stahlbacteria)]|nr:30S ribosomal protein S8 [Candidatus Stahlbacteria bacterium]